MLAERGFSGTAIQMFKFNRFFKFSMIFVRTCCFNYLRKRSQPPQPPAMYDDARENPWILRSQLEKIIHNAMVRQENLSQFEQQKQMKHKPGFGDTTAPPPKGTGTGHDQVRVIYDF